MDLNPTALRARFATLAADRAAIIATSQPLRAERDEIVRETAERVGALDAQIGDVETGLFDLDQEAALISRALGGRTGDPRIAEALSEEG